MTLSPNIFEDPLDKSSHLVYNVRCIDITGDGNGHWEGIRVETRTKTMHINLRGDQVDDYLYARQATSITNDNDLVRFLFRRFRLQGERALGIDELDSQPLLESSNADAPRLVGGR